MRATPISQPTIFISLDRKMLPPAMLAALRYNVLCRSNASLDGIANTASNGRPLVSMVHSTYSNLENTGATGYACYKLKPISTGESYPVRRNADSLLMVLWMIQTRLTIFKAKGVAVIVTVINATLLATH